MPEPIDPTVCNVMLTGWPAGAVKATFVGGRRQGDDREGHSTGDERQQNERRGQSSSFRHGTTPWDPLCPEPIAQRFPVSKDPEQIPSSRSSNMYACSVRLCTGRAGVNAIVCRLAALASG